MKFLSFLLILASCSHQAFQTPSTKYERKDWPHWVDQDRDCQNTRQEILINRSYSDVKLNKKGCTVISGRWKDYYYPQVHTDAKNVDVDHLVPLKHAHLHGGAAWSRQQKEAFANDPENLVITFKSYNRKKGAKGIDEWLPVNHDYACKYIKDWQWVKSKYNLSIGPKEQNTISNSKCKD